jgi:alpha-L-rhamnosidase
MSNSNIFFKISCKTLTTLFVCVIWVNSSPASPSSNSTPYELTVERENQPLGLDTHHPRFSWKMPPQDGVRGQRQTAYQILVATNPTLLMNGKPDVWDSGRVQSSESVMVEPAGLKIKPRTKYYWTLKTWNESNHESPFAPATTFETGILDSADWFKDGAGWIESPVDTVNDEEVDFWAKHAIFRIRDSEVVGGKPTEEDFQNAEQRYHSNMREKVWAGSRLRKDFDVQRVKKARLYISGLGYYRAWINGQRIGSGELAPSDSHYFANVYYQVYDVTDTLQRGKNSLAVELVNGRFRAWYGKTPETYNDRPVLMARLEMEDEDGNTQVVVTDESWVAGDTPLRKHGFWIGELFDARMDQPGWQNVDFNTEDWIPARFAKVGDRLQTFTRDPQAPEKIATWVKPVVETQPKPGVYVFDFGRIIGGRARFTFRGLKEGQRIVVRYSEAIDDRSYHAQYALAHYESFKNTTQQNGMLKFLTRGSTGTTGEIEITEADGSKKTGTLAGATAYLDMFVSAGKPVETWQPDFTYTGFRYLEILGLESRDQLAEIQAFDIYTPPKIVGSLQTDHAALNRILEGTQLTLLINYHSQLQDNLGGERNPNSLNIALNDMNTAFWFDSYPLWTKVGVDTLRITELWDWPVNFVAGMRDFLVWEKPAINISNSLAYGHLPWNTLAFFNDRKMANELLDWTIRWVKETSENTDVWKSYHSSDHIAESSLINLDWGKLMVQEDLGSIGVRSFLSSPDFIKSGFIIRVAKMGASVAEELGREDDARKLSQMLEVFEKRVAEKFRDSETGVWTPEYPLIQGRNSALIWFMMVPRPSDSELAEQIVEEIHTRTNGHQVTGSRLSYPLLHVLSQNGHADEALRLLEREDYPSLLNMINETGGTIRESWDTRNCFAQIEGLNAMSNWFYTDLVGIQPDISHPAFERFTLAPQVPERVGDVNFKYDSPRGKIESHWKRDGEKITWNIVVPPNSVAEISIPADRASGILEGGKSIQDRPELKFLRSENGRQIIEIGSGSYSFGFTSKPT